MRFTYKAQTKEGEIVEGEAEAADRFALARSLHEGDKTVITVEPVHDDEEGILARIEGFLGSIRLRDKILFARNLSSMIEAGLPLSRALGILKRQTRNTALKTITGSLEGDIAKGMSFHNALQSFPGVFSPLFVAMVKAGEESGKLSPSLLIVSEHLERMYILQRRVRGALIYPAIIVIAMVVVGVLMLTYVVPSLAATFKDLNVDLPASTQVIIVLSDLFSEMPFLFAGLFLAIACALFLVFRSAVGRAKVAELAMRIPVIGEIIRNINAARTARTLSSLLASGVNMVEAISITEEVLQNRQYKAVMTEAKERIQKGDTLSKVFIEHENVYPILVAEMTAVGEETGELSPMLLKVATFYEDEVEQATKNLSTIIEPVLMVVIGVVVGFFAFSMITPLYSVLGGI
ncbi:MAG: type II secretion system F family protein [Parcubacteria group bacterium]|nr:type II secretion system F family protein [Parcubacteria group bacterium]